MGKLVVVLVVASLALASGVYLLFQRCQQIEDELISMGWDSRERFEDTDSQLRSLESHGAERQNRIAELESELVKATAALERANSSTAALEQKLDSLGADVATGVASQFTQEVLDAAVAQALAKVVDDKEYLSDPAFLHGVADQLAKKHRDTLRGVPGADASNEVLASLLKQDPDFLDAVSVSILTGK
ncbi:MAG: hypothetical protein AAFY15_04085 [Cyanobacteria bacterium J06648_11]